MTSRREFARATVSGSSQPVPITFLAGLERLPWDVLVGGTTHHGADASISEGADAKAATCFRCYIDTTQLRDVRLPSIDEPGATVDPGPPDEGRGSSAKLLTGMFDRLSGGDLARCRAVHPSWKAWLDEPVELAATGPADRAPAVYLWLNAAARDLAASQQLMLEAPAVGQQPQPQGTEAAPPSGAQRLLDHAGELRLPVQSDSGHTGANRNLSGSSNSGTTGPGAAPPHNPALPSSVPRAEEPDGEVQGAAASDSSAAASASSAHTSPDPASSHPSLHQQQTEEISPRPPQPQPLVSPPRAGGSPRLILHMLLPPPAHQPQQQQLLQVSAQPIASYGGVLRWPWRLVAAAEEAAEAGRPGHVAFSRYLEAVLLERQTAALHALHRVPHALRLASSYVQARRYRQSAGVYCGRFGTTLERAAERLMAMCVDGRALLDEHDCWQVQDDDGGHATAQLSSVRCSLALYSHAADQHLADAVAALQAAAGVPLGAAGADLPGQPQVAQRLAAVTRPLLELLVSARRGLRAAAGMVPRLGSRPPAGCRDAVGAAGALQGAVRSVAELLVRGEGVWGEHVEQELRVAAGEVERLLARVAPDVAGGGAGSAVHAG
ncbi:hypothetical protein PLESTB_000640500 [Pleodorina starrii]|uniref:Uncharacterized protein n=1 Tax=Pleodorina starrii TaxID=330485 RepID=A0A9W6BJF4_9CHLO|nr:hypothetical protein PLESTM_001301700 [Pleodorina starrii]GLC52536.1 hypothetical protein PLESTB_000640500 [Pleodorina starrii]GLC71536.1 hypothetical protein PLESTF_001132600 [Pleodorina starrii]